jgi:hypothetical protein
MTLIEDLCAAVPPADPARLAAIRTRVLDEAGRALPRELRSTPAPRANGTVRPVPRGGLAPKPGSGWLSWPRLALAAGTAMALVVALAVAGVLPFGGAPGPSASAAVLNRAAAAALAQPAPTDAQLVYTESSVYYTTYARHGRLVPAGHVLVRQEEWQSPVSPTAFFRTSPCDAFGDLQRSRGTCGFQGGYAPGASAYSTYAGLRRLPTSAGPLLAYLARLPSAGHSVADREWAGASLVAWLNPVLPPRFGAALFRAVARIPGAVLLPSATDAAGARGIGVARVAGGVRQELIFDPGTYRLIGQQDAVPGRAHVLWARALRHVRFVSTGPGSASATGPGAGPVLHGTPRDGQFIYTQVHVMGIRPASMPEGPRLTVGQATEQLWQSVDGSAPGAFGTAPCHAGQTCLVLIPPEAAAPALSTYAGLAALPRSPGALLSYLQQHGTCPASAGAGARAVHVSLAARQWSMVAGIVGNNQVLPAGLGKALFRAAAKIPGAMVLPGVTDAAGGRGIAVARAETPALRAELIFAPRSYRFIGVQEVVTRGTPGLRAGTVWAASSLVAAAIVDSAPVTSLSQAYSIQTCGYTPGFYTIGGSGTGSSSSGSSSSGSSSSGSSSSSSSSSGSASSGPT